jgi:hypothetical protein
MKVRSGFVSNSSSSSFLIYGITVEQDDLAKVVKAACDAGDVKDYDGNVKTWDEAQEEAEQLYGLAEMLPIPKGSDIETHTPSYYDQAFIGASWDSVKDDETGKEFKARVLKSLKTIGFDVKAADLGTHSEAWRDG